MATFTVASFTSNANGNNRGQSFAADVAGPAGTGSPTATTVYVQSVSIGYPTSSTTSRASAAYLYSSIPLITDLNNGGTGAMAASTGDSDGSLFGTGTYSRTFTFNNVAIDPTQTYYILFSKNQNICYDTTDPYSGGNVYTTVLGSANESAQFQVSLTD